MASIIDLEIARHGTLVVSGLYWARAGDREWTRDDGESEADFLARARRSARGEGFRVLRIGGAVETIERGASP
jgi:hypothetical protein